jgi:hypothetical protein
MRIELAEQLSNEHAVLALRVIGDRARGIRRDDERVIGHVDWRKPVGVGAETAFIRIASRGVEDGQRGASTPLLDRVEYVSTDIPSWRTSISFPITASVGIM